MAVVTPKKDPFGRPQSPSPTYPEDAHRGEPFPFTVIGEEEEESPEMDYDVAARMRQLYQPETQSQEQFNELLGQYPERGNPGIIRRIGASMAGLGPGGYEVAHKAAYQPFYDKLEDWKARMDPAQAAMTNERASNANLRALANQTVTQEMSDRRLERLYGRDAVLRRQADERIGQGQERLDETARRNQELEAQGRARNDIALMRAKGGKPKLDPETGQWSMLFSDGSTLPIPFNQLSEIDKMSMTQEDALERIRVGAQERASNQRDRIVKQYGIHPQTGETVLGDYNLDTHIFTPAVQGQPPPGASVTPALAGETEEAKAITARALEVKNSNSAWAKYIEFDNAGRFKRIKPPSFFGMLGPNEATFKQIFQAIYGRQPTQQELSPGPTGAGVNTQPTTNTGQPDPTELVEVINPKGQRVRIRRSQLAEALKYVPKAGEQPYREVK